MDLAVKRQLALAKRIAECRTLNDLLGYAPMQSNLNPQTISLKRMNQNEAFWFTR